MQLHRAHRAGGQQLRHAVALGHGQVAGRQGHGQLVIERMGGRGPAADPVVQLPQRRPPAPPGRRGPTPRSRSTSRAGHSRDSSRFPSCYFCPSLMQRAKDPPHDAAVLHPLAARRCNLPRRIELRGASSVSFINSGTLRSSKNARVLNAPTSSSSPQAAVAADVVQERLLKDDRPPAGLRGRRPLGRTSAARRPSRAAQSTDLGHRVEQVMQETHCQMASARIAFSTRPSCTSRITWFGSTSMCWAIGQPAEHLPHW